MVLPEIENTIVCNFWFDLVYAVVDTEECLYRRLLGQKNIPFKVQGVYEKQGDKYQIHLLRIKRKHVEDFRDIAEQVTRTRLLMGFTDYAEYCTLVRERVRPREGQHV